MEISFHSCKSVESLSNKTADHIFRLSVGFRAEISAETERSIQTETETEISAETDTETEISIQTETEISAETDIETEKVRSQLYTIKRRPLGIQTKINSTIGVKAITISFVRSFFLSFFLSFLELLHKLRLRSKVKIA